MAMSQTDHSQARHPWLELFLANPEAETDRLLTGRARIAPYESADAPDAAWLVFGGLTADDVALGTLDAALLKWLKTGRTDGVPALEPLPLARWIRTVSDAFEIIGRLALPECAADLRREFNLWNSWAARLAHSDQRDGRKAFYRTLALTQRLVAGNVKDPFALQSFWLQMCQQAGSELPAQYLSVGLLGLRMLPEQEGLPADRPWLAGLASWAASQNPTKEEFSQQWWALKGLFPRLQSYWSRSISETLKGRFARTMSGELKAWWAEDAGVQDGTIPAKPATRPAGVPNLLPLEAVNSVLDNMRQGQPLGKVRNEINQVIDNFRQYARATCDSHFLVTTACNLGMALIKAEDEPVDRGEFAAELAREALDWQPTDFYVWELWREALARQGAFDAAEEVGWETIRRFPENLHSRTALAELLSRLPGREPDAERLLRETAKRFPNNAYSWTQLGGLLARLPGRKPDAERLLRETAKRFPKDAYPRNQLIELLIAQDRSDEAAAIVDSVFAQGIADAAAFDLRARLFSSAGDPEAARKILQDGMVEYPKNVIIQVHLAMLDEGRVLPLKAEVYRAETELPRALAAANRQAGKADSGPVRRGGRLRRLLTELSDREGDEKWRAAALDEVQETLAHDPNFAYADYVNRELHGARDAPAPGTFAIAFAEAVKRKEPDRFAELEKSSPGHVPMIDMARVVLFQDEEAGDRTVAWLDSTPGGEPRAVQALRGFLDLRMRSVQSERANFVELVAANDNIELDLIESALAEFALPLAA